MKCLSNEVYWYIAMRSVVGVDACNGARQNKARMQLAVVHCLRPSGFCRDVAASMWHDSQKTLKDDQIHEKTREDLAMHSSDGRILQNLLIFRKNSLVSCLCKWVISEVWHTAPS